MCSLGAIRIRLERLDVVTLVTLHLFHTISINRTLRNSISIAGIAYSHPELGLPVVLRAYCGESMIEVDYKSLYGNFSDHYLGVKEKAIKYSRIPYLVSVFYLFIACCDIFGRELGRPVVEQFI